MALIAGVRVPSKKRLVIGLTYIYGVGPHTAQQICQDAGISVDKRVHDLTDDELTKIREIIGGDSYIVEGDLRRLVSARVKELRDIGCYRGRRPHLPVRGQKTRNNAKTRKRRGGSKNLPIAGKKKATK